MLTAKELEVQEVFDKALKKAWDAYYAVEVPAKETRQNAVDRAYEDLKKACSARGILCSSG